MTDFRAIFDNLRRPRLLIRAARFGLQDYHRDRDLRRLLQATASPERAVPQLLAEEARLEEIRQTGEFVYEKTKGVEICPLSVVHRRSRRVHLDQEISRVPGYARLPNVYSLKAAACPLKCYSHPEAERF